MAHTNAQRYHRAFEKACQMRDEEERFRRARDLQQEWNELQSVPAYCERYSGQDECLTRDMLESEALHECMVLDNPAYATADDVALMDLYDM
jgi:hypothetical protein